jgi:hypothetical protein
MSTLRISNIEAKSVPASATTDEKIKITNSSGDVLVFLDGKTSGITTVGINTTDGNLKFDANSNIVVSGIVTATAFYGDGSNLTGIAADKIYEGNTEVETVDTGSNGHIKFTTEGSERLRIQPDGTLVTGAQTIPTSSDIGNIYIKNASAIGSQSHQINYVSNAVFNGAWKYINSSLGATQIVVNQNLISVNFAPSGTAGNNITFSETLRISNDGTIGVNQSDGTAKTLKGIHISKGTGNGAAPNTYSLANEYLHFGFSEYNPSGNRGLFVMGFGYVGGSTNATKSPAYLGFNEETDGGYTKGSLVFATRNVVTDTSPTERLRIGAGGGHKITCAEGYFAANLTECNDGRIALNINQTRSGYTKGIAIGAVGTADQNTGIQAYDTSNNSANPLLLNPFGGKINIGCPDNGTSNAALNVEDSSNISAITLKLINKPSGANGRARLVFSTETSSGQGAEPYIMSTSGTDAFGSNAANDGGLQFHTRHGGSGTDVNALEISNKGYVLQPARPYFKAEKSAAITGTGVVVWNNVVYNNGGHYDNSNGRFTAPIAGLYWFSAKINAYNRCDFWLQKNGTRFERGQYNTDSDSVGWWSNQLTSIVEMTAGQYVEVYVSSLSQNTDPGEWLTFMGYLIS